MRAFLFGCMPWMLPVMTSPGANSLFSSSVMERFAGGHSEPMVIELDMCWLIQ